MKKQPLTLAIDTSCDETSASVVHGLTVLSNVLPSQIEFHRKYGGIVPSVARLAHQERIDGVVEETLKLSKVKMEDIDLIAVTIGPGLAIALEVGIQKAKELAAKYSKPLIAINHMEGHLLSSFAQRNSREKEGNGNKKEEEMQGSNKDEIKNTFENIFPALGVLVSGKHTELVLVKGIGGYEIIGETMDDACGEAFDKCGRMLGFGYPAGPIIAEFAETHRKNIKFEIVKHNLSTLVRGTNIDSGRVYELPIAMANSGDLNFSYSGLKTAFKQLIQRVSGEEITIEAQIEGDVVELSKDELMDLCVMFEEAAFKPIELKLTKAIDQYKPKEIWLGGGVAANVNLRSKLRSIAKKDNIVLRAPFGKNLTTDNAAMIGIVANVKFMNNVIQLEHNPSKGIFLKDYILVDRDPTLALGE